MSENLGSSADSGHYSRIGTYFLYNPLDGKETHDEENMTTDLIAEDFSRESFYVNMDYAEGGTYGTPIIPSLNKNEKVAGSGRRSIIESVCDDDEVMIVERYRPELNLARLTSVASSSALHLRK